MKKPAQKRSTSKKQQPETLKLTIDRLDHDGIGLAPYNNKIAVVQGAFPGETVIAEVEHIGRTHIFTRLLRTLRNAQQRTTNVACKVEHQCLGCPLISMKYSDQLLFKQQRVTSALQKQGLLDDIDVPAVFPSDPPFGYRASAKLAFSRHREKVFIGLYKRGSHEVIDCPECPVHHPLINKITAVVRDEVQRQNISVYNSRHQRGLLRYLVVRVSPHSGKALVTFVSNFRDLQQLPKLAKWLMRKVPEVIGVHQNINSSGGNVILGEQTMRLQGLPDLIETIGDIRLRIAPEAFFQINTTQAARIYALVRQWAQLNKQDSAIDLYCGIGGIALHLAKDAGQVEGIEYFAGAVRNATENSHLNNLNNCHFFAGDAAEELQKRSEQRNPTLITVNPPRKGCSDDLLEALYKLQPKQIIYVSCDPDSLSRDLKTLTENGYKIKQLQPVDMFPQTAHIETVVQLERIDKA
ncbi:23S rRNA m(5)U-1939 methyltransferase [Desulfuromusa kysingii]|uniref:23S rRNA m(5)U-1939 methyltransferase n=1 Tax=Desulfuromusa kysingii TaxID=37625 RepID=A0A1H3WAF7_9BACT|nr:23S rRNA (uracil(1939)-C(5))-methyltransferase RlmD [Desulfuromusa kysingii]SDZ84103.1 23S rRNA m(5)U-1939 methyltransferase [Desulfuromusa kysingii]